jgi:hypothetical protein
VARRSPMGWQDSWPLGLGNRTVHRSPRYRARESSIGNEHLDKISRHCNSRQYDSLDGLRGSICHRGTEVGVLDRIRRCCAKIVPKCSLLAAVAGPTCSLFVKRFCMEIVSADSHRINASLLTNS